MSERRDHSTILQALLDRLARGDQVAREELISHSMERLRKLARKMLRDNARLRRWNETDDVLQNALLRLNRALQSVRPESVGRFIGLAAEQIRRELIDLGRHDFGPQGIGKNHASDPYAQGGRGTDVPRYEQAAEDSSDSVIHTNEMERFHIAVGQLSDEQREVFQKWFYLGMTQENIATAADVSVRTIKRTFRDAKLRLAELLGGDSEA